MQISILNQTPCFWAKIDWPIWPFARRGERFARQFAPEIDGSQSRIEKLVMKQGKMIGYFVSDQQSDYYQTQSFRNVI